MTLGEFREMSKEIPDSTNLGIMFDKKISENTLDLISIELFFNYNKDENMLSIATVRKNYLTMDEAEDLVNYYEDKLKYINNVDEAN